MIRFGLSGWNNHDALYPPLTKDKLSAYCVHFLGSIRPVINEFGN